MRIRFQFRMVALHLLSYALLLAGATAATRSPDRSGGGGAMVKKISGDGMVQVIGQDGAEMVASSGKNISLPAVIVTGRSRVMLAMPGRKIAIGQHSSCRIGISGDVEIEDDMNCAVAVQPSGGTLQQVTCIEGAGLVEAGASPAFDGELTEGAVAARDRARVRSAKIKSKFQSLAIVHAPARRSGGYFKIMLFEGDGTVEVKGEETVDLDPHQMSLIPADRSQLRSEIRCADFNLERAVETSALIEDFREFWDMSRVNVEIARQRAAILRGDYVSFRRQEARRGAPTGVEDRAIIRSLRGKLRKGKR